MKSRWIQPNGDEEEHDTLEAPSLLQMQEYVGGYIELVSVLYEGKPCHMIVNETGMIDELPINPTATDIYHEAQVKPRCEKNGVLYIASNYAQIHGPAIIFAGRLP